MLVSPPCTSLFFTPPCLLSVITGTGSKEARGGTAVGTYEDECGSVAGDGIDEAVLAKARVVGVTVKLRVGVWPELSEGVFEDFEVKREGGADRSVLMRGGLSIESPIGLRIVL